jgi:hypothetical protein
MLQTAPASLARTESVSPRIRIGVLGASGYTGADLVRLALCHPAMEIAVLTANSHAGKPMADVFPHLGFVDLPDLTTIDDADWGAVDAVFCGLPHGTTQEITKKVLADHPKIKFIDMSADFRLDDPETYKAWYGHEHQAPELQAEAVYGRPSTIVTGSGRRGWSPARAAIRRPRSSPSCRSWQAGRSMPATSSSTPSRACRAPDAV